jgi:UDP-glucuronate 4-epimerase
VAPVFIGSNLINTLFRNNPGIKITCIDNFDPFLCLPISKQLNIKDFKFNPDFHFLNIDLATISSTELCDLIDDHVDTIVHIAAKAGVRPSILNP